MLTFSFILFALIFASFASVAFLFPFQLLIDYFLVYAFYALYFFYYVVLNCLTSSLRMILILIHVLL